MSFNLEPVNKSYQDRLRILLIIYFFSEPCTKVELPHCKRLLKSELKIQKIDFLIRNPDYLAFELLEQMELSTTNRNEIKEAVQNIFVSREPDIRRIDMIRFFFGAYEDIDDIISFFISRDFLHFESRKGIDRRVFEKEYYLTEYGLNKIQNDILPGLLKVRWYEERCKLIKKYFGDLSGTELKVRQYQHEEYRTTPLNEYISQIKEKVTDKFKEIYGEDL